MPKSRRPLPCLLPLSALALLMLGEAAGQSTARGFRERSSGRNATTRSLRSESQERASGGKPEPKTPPAAATNEETVSANERKENLRPGQWTLESLRLRDGTEYRGLVQAKRESEYEFAEIVQPPGAPMHAVIRGIPLETVDKVVRLPRSEHQQLVDRFAKFRNRAMIEAGRIDQADLHLETRESVTYRVYRGDWFELWSTTDDEPTRRCVVRLEQIFRAYRTVLPPRTTPRGRLQVYLYGSLDEYRARLRQLDLSIDNAAFYAPRQRMIVAGSELTSFARRLQELRSKSAEMQRDYLRLDREFTKGLAVLSGELKSKGFSGDEIAAELAHRKGNWKSEMKAALDGVQTAQRQNEAKFIEVTGQMFARLYHEAFHAYLDHFVFPHDKHHVPRWLNEGLAQVFESGQLDGDLLRIDAPSRDRLLALQGEFDELTRLPLAEVLAAADPPFLVPHAFQGAADDERMYLYAWGLAWYLAFERNALGSEALQTYLAEDAQQVDPIRRFEQLVGQPLPEFEKEWRASLERQRTR